MDSEELLEEHEPKGEQPEVSNQPGEQDGQGGGRPTPKPAADPEMKRLQRENAALLRRAQEAEGGRKFWYEKATAAAANAEPEPEPEPEPEKVSVDLVEAVTAGDARALRQALAEMGFVSRKDMEKEIQTRIGQARTQITEEAKLYGKYPDLQDEQSELFQKTREVYLDLAKDPAMAKSSRLVETAARLAASELGMEERQPARSRRREEPPEVPEEDFDEEEAERVERVRSQEGSRGRPHAAAGRTQDEDLSPMQRSIVARFRAAGANITEDGYRKRAQAGIRLSGLPTRRGSSRRG
jgi:hypothetical protein